MAIKGRLASKGKRISHESSGTVGVGFEVMVGDGVAVGVTVGITLGTAVGDAVAETFIA